MKTFTCRLFIVLCALVTLFCNLPDAGAKIEWSILKNIPLEDTPRDIALSREGTTRVYSLQQERAGVLVNRQQDYRNDSTHRGVFPAGPFTRRRKAFSHPGHGKTAHHYSN